MKIDIAAVKDALAREKDRLLEERDSIEGPDSEMSQTEEMGDLSDYSDHPADAASATYDRERDMALVDNVEDLVKKVDRAMEKLDEGSYGKCDRCSEQIPAKRLQALPYATLCLHCQDMEDAI